MATTDPIAAEAEPARMSFREQSIWATLGVSLIAYGYYFTRAWIAGPSADAGSVLGMFIGTVVLLVILLIAVHIVIALRTPQEVRDERDVAIDLRAVRIAYGVLTASLWGLMPVAVFWASAKQTGPLIIERPVILGHTLFLCFVLAELAKLIAQAVLYRRKV